MHTSTSHAWQVQSNVEDLAVGLRELAEADGWEAVVDGSLAPEVSGAEAVQILQMGLKIARARVQTDLFYRVPYFGEVINTKKNMIQPCKVMIQSTVLLAASSLPGLYVVSTTRRASSCRVVALPVMFNAFALCRAWYE